MSYLDDTGLAYFWQKIKTVLYSANNPPPYPVTSVNNQTGAVSVPEIDDSTTSEYDTWSSQKITEAIAGANDSNTGYCKFPDGTLLCWGIISVPSHTEISKAWGSAYESGRIEVRQNFPVAFVSNPELIVSLNSSPVSFLENNLTASTTGINGAYWLMRPQSVTLNNGFITWLAIGRWK